jgi:ABC-2 type transport system permease protein
MSHQAVYDSERNELPVLSMLATLARHRALVGLLTRRSLTARYKRSWLGAWWTLLNPLLEATVLWLVFSHVFRLSSPGVPYVVYLLSGILLYGLFRDTLLAVSSALAANAPLVSRVNLPIESVAAAAALSVLVGFAFSLVAFVLVMVGTGTPILATLPLALVPALLLVVLATGIGMAVAPLALRYPDLLEFERIGLTLLGYLVPVFYPLSIVPARFGAVVRANPLTHYLDAFRSLAYQGAWPGTGAAVVVVVCALGALGVGGLLFARARVGAFDWL